MAGQAGTDNMVWIAGVLAVLLLVVVVGSAVVYRLRKRAVGPVGPLGSDQVSFTLDQLRQMRDEGVLSQAEYQRIREKLLEGQGD